MKQLPAGLATLLASGVTTLCRCWRLQRVDGQVFGFTDHDRKLSFGGDDYQPQTGFTASEMTSALGLAVDTMNVEGALSSDAITETDIALGLWDNAEVTIFAVDWSETANRTIVRQGNLGELTRGDVAMQAEIRSLAHVLNQEQGRTYQRLCDAVVGDARCGVDLTAPANHGAGVVLAAEDDRYLQAIGLADFAAGWFTQGVLTWTSGPNAGAKIELRAHALSGATATLALWQRAARPIAAGDGFTVTVGCARTFGVCHAKFGNAANFRGFPHIPGNDFAMGVVKQDATNDGGSFFPMIITRQDIVDEARSWAGTPYRHQGSLKSVACDCLGLVRGVWRAKFGSEPETMPAYSPDWAEAAQQETLLAAALRHLRPVAVADATIADVLIFRWQPHLPAKHCAIITAPGRIIHAYDAARVVAEVNLAPAWQRRMVAAFSFPGVS